MWGTREFDTALIIIEPCLIMPRSSYSRPTMYPVVLCRNNNGVFDSATESISGRETAVIHNNSDSAMHVIVLRLDQNIFSANVPRAEEVTDITLASLPTFRANQVEKGITSTSLADARDTIDQLRDIAARCADPAQANAPGTECGGVE